MRMFNRRAVMLAGVLALVMAAAFSTVAHAEIIAPGDFASSVWSDKADYAPGELVTLSGGHWQAGESVQISVNDDAGSTWSRNVDVTADAGGNITDQFYLPDWFVAQYSVKATGSAGAGAATSFTDGNIDISPSRVPAAAFAPVQAGQQFVFPIQANKSGGGNDPQVATSATNPNALVVAADTKNACGTAGATIPASWLSIVAPALPRTVPATPATTFSLKVAPPAAAASGDYRAVVSFETAPGTGGSGNFALCVHVSPADSTAPTTTATGKNADGTTYASDTWTRQNATVTLSADDGNGSGVKSIAYS